MKLIRSLLLLAAVSLTAFAGGLYLEVSQGASGALLTAKVTACHEPAKSTVTAYLVTFVGGQLQRQPIKVTPIVNQPGVFSIFGALPDTRAVVELAVTNPQFKDYQPRVLIRSESGKLQLASKHHFFSVPPNPGDYRQALQGAQASTD
jgi:hypothetical protein